MKLGILFVGHVLLFLSGCYVFFSGPNYRGNPQYFNKYTEKIEDWDPFYGWYYRIVDVEECDSEPQGVSENLGAYSKWWAFFVALFAIVCCTYSALMFRQSVVKGSEFR